jgi:hypothetical protein
MLTRQLRSLAACIILSLAIVPTVCAQESTPSIFGHAIKLTFLDPTTYPASALYYDATMRDWNSSQPFFRNGFVERNPRFTATGVSGDTAVGYDAGRQQIIKDTFEILGVSAVHNLSTHLLDEALKQRYPEHRKLITFVGWAERIGASSWMSYQVSASHYRQWKRNEQLSAQLGLR